MDRRAKMREYSRRPEVREKARLRQKTQEYKEYQKRYRESHRKKMDEYQKKYQEEHKVELQIKQNARRKSVRDLRKRMEREGYPGETLQQFKERIG